MNKKTLFVQNNDVAIISKGNEDYITLTDISKSQMQDDVIIKWLSLKSTIESLGEWEILYKFYRYNCQSCQVWNMNDHYNSIKWLTTKTLNHFIKKIRNGVTNNCDRDRSEHETQCSKADSPAIALI